jgi:hypothetical protein
VTLTARAGFGTIVAPPAGTLFIFVEYPEKLCYFYQRRKEAFI